MNLSNLAVEEIAFESKTPDRGYTIRASYLKEPHRGDALIEIFKDGNPLRTFTFPAYKIWNLAAHFKDIVDCLLDSIMIIYQEADLADVMDFFAKSYKGKILAAEWFIDTQKRKVVFRLHVEDTVRQKALASTES